MSYPDAPQQPPQYPQAPGYGRPSQPAQPTRLRGRTPRRLGWIFLVAGIVLIVVGAVIGTTKSLGKVTGFHRVTFADGSATVTLDGTGKWVGYYEADNVSSSIKRIPGFQAAVTDPSGQPVALTIYGNRSDHKVKKLTYDYKGHHGAAAFQFDAKQKGQYRIQIQASEQLPSDADIAIGRDIEKAAIIAGLFVVLGALVIVAAIVLLIVGFVKRSRHKKELQAAPYGGPPPPGYAPQGPPPGYQQQGPPPGYQQQAPPPGYPQQGPPPGYPQQGPPPGYPQQNPVPPPGNPPQFGEPQQGPPQG